MAGTNLSFPFDSEIFNYSWKQTPDIYLTNMLSSGAVVQDGDIANMISNGSNFFTVPFYNLIDGTEENYNGVDDMTTSGLTGSTYSGCVYGRMKGWSAKSFISDFNSGADPMSQIVAGVANYWIKKRQSRLISIMEAVFNITGNADWALHTTDLSTAGVAQVEKAVVTTGSGASANATVIVTALGMTGSPKTVTVALASGDDASAVAGKVRTALIADANVGHVSTGFFTVSGTGADIILTAKAIAVNDSTMAITYGAGTTGIVIGASTDVTPYVAVTDANRIGETTINDAIVTACGDLATDFSLVIAHSVIANRLANLQLVGYSKYTDAMGITRELPIGTINGKTLIINDNVPVVTSTGSVNAKEYTTYALGLGAIRYASAPVDVPSEMDRDPAKYGGLDMIYTRLRESMMPYGVSFKGDVTTDVSVPDAVLFNASNWELKMPAKSIKMVRVITN